MRYLIFYGIYVTQIYIHRSGLISSILFFAIYRLFPKINFRFEIIVLKLMLFRLFGREFICFEYLDISLDLTSEKFSQQQQIPLKCIGEAKFWPKQHEFSAQTSFNMKIPIL